jgi:hypothetical protein
MAETPFERQAEPADYSSEASAKSKKRKISIHAWYPSNPQWENDDDDDCPYVDLDTDEYVGSSSTTWDHWSQIGTRETYRHDDDAEASSNTTTVLADGSR